MENETKKISLSTFLLILAIIIIAIMGVIIFKLNNEKNIGTQTTTSNNLKSEDIKYEISTRKNEYDEEISAVIKAIKDGKTVTKEFDTGALIADTGTMELPTIGNVALVADSAGEYYGINIYQLVNDEIKHIGTIHCGIDMVADATYEVTTKGETTVVITAKRNNENIKKEFEMDAAIAKTEVIDVFNRGKLVLVAENGGESPALKVFRLSVDYITDEAIGIIEAGTIQY